MIDVTHSQLTVCRITSVSQHATLLGTRSNYVELINCLQNADPYYAERVDGLDPAPTVDKYGTNLDVEPVQSIVIISVLYQHFMYSTLESP